MAAKGGHKVKTKGKKAAKRKAAVQKKAPGASEKALTAKLPKQPSRERNPRAFTNTSRGRAKQQQARSAEKSQRRLHCESASFCAAC